MPDREPVAAFKTLEHPGPPFAGMELDRAVTLRQDRSWVVQQLDAPASRAVAAGSDGVLVDDADGRLVRTPLAAVALRDREPVLLGLEGAVALFAVDLDALDPAEAARIAQSGRIVGLRDAGAGLPHPEGGLAAYAVALLNWHRRNSHCANCGAVTDVAEAGFSKHCPRCGAVHFPRTDPVVIMLVESEDGLLLGRRTGWPAGRYSVLAGFVSPGESVEEAVVREVREESGIDAYGPTFVTSQPWPFPSSLMLGFEARSDGGRPAALDGELEDVRWFTGDAVRSAALGGDGELVLPPHVSIARFLIERWIARVR